ncbi:DUF3817 domain-containing protein [Demequina flava]|uniref:DUF3817 domain-containing protein n=1 Tax=Demequina flava TaxID=1095025 RepID=UPI000781F934|nr:DUF3817 domain-containing protein [Demequina flava]
MSAATDTAATTRTPFKELPGISRAYVVLAFIEGFTWAGLLVGMLMEHVLHVTEWGVTVFGPLHGGAFMLYGLVTLIAAVKLRWGFWVTIAALAAAVPPLTTIPMEMWLRRKGKLDAR